jgi:Na+/H+ antiporter NhaD/arsenite permease-like protein
MHASLVPSLPWILPFVLMLLSIAVLPLAAPHFWEPNSRKLVVSALLGLPVLVLYGLHSPLSLLHTGQEYVSFLILLGGLFVISGGVLIDGDVEARPIVNTAILALGALLASFIGTTGASMVLIRPLLRTNSERKHVVHTIVFFIFLVSNIGGCLTPLGDPPLFLGYLRGVPFAWTLRLFPHWLVATGLVLAVYFVWDLLAQKHETWQDRLLDHTTKRPFRIAGGVNFLFLLGVLGAVAFLDAPWRELAIIAVSVTSWLLTDKGLRHANRFTFGPILEVAALFAGIFLTMIPALDYLRAHGAELGVRAPWHFFWATGALSSFLDNAPTYLTFLALGQGLGLAPEVVGVPHTILAAISVGAVFMGANTYIGNGPNFMVRAIAEEHGVKMPSFFHYMGYSVAVLIPVFVIVTFVFFR